MSKRRVILTGGPGAGKTTLLTALAGRGYRALGFELIELPCVSVEQRCEFVLEQLRDAVTR